MSDRQSPLSTLLSDETWWLKASVISSLPADGHLCDSTGIKNGGVKHLVQALTAKKQRAGLWVMESDSPTAESTHLSPAFFPQWTSGHVCYGNSWRTEIKANDLLKKNTKQWGMITGKQLCITLKYTFLFHHMYVCGVSLCLHGSMSTRVRMLTEARDIWSLWRKPKLGALVSHPWRVLGTELKPSGKAVHALSYCALSPVIIIANYNYK